MYIGCYNCISFLNHCICQSHSQIRSVENSGFERTFRKWACRFASCFLAVDYASHCHKCFQIVVPPTAEEGRHDVMFKHVMHLAYTINCILLAITHAYKYSWLLKPRFSRYFAGGSEGLSRLKDLLFEDEYRGAEDRAKLHGYNR